MVSISWRNILMLIFHNFISFFLFLFVFQLQLSIVLFVIHYQFSNYNYNYVVSGSWLKNSRIAYVNLPSCLKKIGSCLSTHWFCFLFLFCFCFFFVCFSFVLFGFFFRFCFVFFSFVFTQITSSTQHTSTGKSYAWTLLDYVTYTLPETTRYMTVWPKKINNKSAEMQQLILSVLLQWTLNELDLTWPTWPGFTWNAVSV